MRVLNHRMSPCFGQKGASPLLRAHSLRTGSLLSPFLFCDFAAIVALPRASSPVRRDDSAVLPPRSRQAHLFQNRLRKTPWPPWPLPVLPGSPERLGFL